MEVKGFTSMVSLGRGNTASIEEYLKSRKKFIDVALERLLTFRSDNRLHQLEEALRYSLFSGGKRLRPILTLAVAEMYGPPKPAVLDCGCAIEMLHCSSLVIDDLPVMDNSDFRRGHPSCHRMFSQATAILATLALASKAFELIARSARENSLILIPVLDTVVEIATSIGLVGAVGGQFADLNPALLGTRQPEFVCERKTAALFSVACTTGARLSGASVAEIVAIDAYGKHLGHAYQIRDDLLDVIGERDKLGKEILQDAKNKRVTFVESYGLAGCKEKLSDQVRMAVEAIAAFGKRGMRLKQIARYAQDRTF